MNRMDFQGKTLRVLPNLRYAVPRHTTTEPPILQQAWENIHTGEIEWIAVPRVVSDGDTK